MATEKNPVQELEQLRDLINSSIDIIKKNVTENGDPPLTLKTNEPHPIYSRNDPHLAQALRTVSSSAQMLRALLDPNTFLNDIIYGYHDETALLVACQADVPNLIGDTDRHIDEIAAQAGLNADKLGRFLRNLCNSYIFEETAPNRFANNALSARFKPEGKRAIVGHCADEARVSSCKSWEALTLPEYKDSTEANKAPFNIAYNTSLTYFQYVATERQDIGIRAKKAMAGKGFNLGQYLSLYPWGSQKGAKIVDVGGGIGAATFPILQANPDLRLTVQDIPDTGPEFQKNLEQNFPDILKTGRAEFMELDFFKSAPVKGADIYFLRHVIHDWPDAEAIKILSGCTSSMSAQSKLLICEHVVCPTYRSADDSTTAEKGSNSEPHFVAPEPLLANWGDAPTSRLDLQVYTCLNAKQRTKLEYQALVQQAGLKLVKVWRNLGDETILECLLR
ncbi:hypothetical protein DTO063F5_2313 [Paecilomyces variotii]|nr:hypothetical protein DTO063F5_2313 [Paecilomyces variotii]